MARCPGFAVLRPLRGRPIDPAEPHAAVARRLAARIVAAASRRQVIISGALADRVDAGVLIGVAGAVTLATALFAARFVPAVSEVA